MVGKKAHAEVPSELTNLFRVLREDATGENTSTVKPVYTTLIDGDRRYVEVSDTFCELVGYRREDLIGKRYDDLTAPGTNDIPTVFRLFVRNGYMHGLWMLKHRDGTPILVRYESWVRSDCLIQGKMELVAGSAQFSA